MGVHMHTHIYSYTNMQYIPLYILYCNVAHTQFCSVRDIIVSLKNLNFLR